MQTMSERRAFRHSDIVAARERAHPQNGSQFSFEMKTMAAIR